MRFTKTLLLGLLVLCTAQTPPPDLGDRVRYIEFGSGGTIYYNPYCDTIYQSGNISSAGATLAITAVPGKNIYVCLAGIMATGTNTANAPVFKWGQGSTCVTNSQTLVGANATLGSTNGEWIDWWTNAAMPTNIVTGLPGPAAMPLIIPQGFNVCFTTAGTPSAATVIYYSIH